MLGPGVLSDVVAADSWRTSDEELNCLPEGESAGNTGSCGEHWVFSALLGRQDSFVLGVYWVYAKRV